MAILTYILILILSWLSSRIIREWNRFYRPEGFPPGPFQYPLIGNLWEFRRSPLQAMMKWRKEYGDIVGLRLGQFRVVQINDPEMIKDAFTKEAFNGRPEFKPAMLFTGGEKHGTLTSEGDPWDTVRKFTIKNLNALGFGKRSMEGFILNDISSLLGDLRKEVGKLVEFKNRFYIPTTNHLWYILIGSEIPEERKQEFQTVFINLNKALWLPIGRVIWMMPWLTNIFPRWTGLQKLKEMLPPFRSLVQEQIPSHMKSSLDQKTGQSNPSEDLMTAFCSEIKMAENDTTSHFHGSSGQNHMTGMILNLFITAAEAVTNNLNWGLLYLSLYPRVQEKLAKEIQETIGCSRCPSLSDQAMMPYTSAVIQELLRVSSSSPFSNFQMTTQDVVFRGYVIPKNTIIIANLYGVHHGEENWESPEEFRPERFLKNNALITHPNFMPFSVGLRTCLGQTFARNSIFLILTSLIQNFKFQWDPSIPEPTEEELTIHSNVSIFRFTMPFKLILKERDSIAAPPA